MLVFFIGLVLSFVGSMPLGLINVSIAEACIKRGLRVALIMGVGAAFVELLQSFFIVRFSYLLLDTPGIERWFHYFALILFFILSLYYFLIAKPIHPVAKQVGGYGASPFFKGVALSSLNFMVFPYWLFYGAFLNSNGWLEINTFVVFIFSLGVMVGAFLLFVLYARLGRWVFLHAGRVVRRINLIVGFIFLSLALYQFYVLWQV